MRLEQFARFPPTVVDHTEYENGVSLGLLDGGTENEPRVIHVYDKHASDWVNVENPFQREQREAQESGEIFDGGASGKL